MKEVTIFEAGESETTKQPSRVEAVKVEEVKLKTEVEVDTAKEQELREQLEAIKQEVKGESLELKTEKPNGTEIRFYGQHSDERILYEVRPHPFSIYLSFLKVVLAGLVVWLALIMVGKALPVVAGVVQPLGFWAGLLLIFMGIVAVKYAEKKQVAYITDRRVIRFSGVNPWAINTRSLTWDEAVKVKTYPNNLIWRLLNIGTVTIHAKSTIVNFGDAPISNNVITNDDVELTHVWYYRDLGNYIDKILFMYKQKPKDLASLRPFVTKGRGKRF